MAKQIVKGLTMLMLVVGLAFVTAAISANGQTSNHVVANIPFEFIVGDKSLPSGKYDVRQTSSGGAALRIASQEAKAGAIRLAMEIPAKRDNGNARLVFHRYGQQYFLAEVWSGADARGRQLVKSRQERALERELASIGSKSEFAMNSYETVEVVAMVR